MKITGRVARNGRLTIRFRAGKGEGGDLRDALMQAGKGMTPEKMVALLGSMGYQRVSSETTNKTFSTVIAKVDPPTATPALQTPTNQGDRQ